MKYYRVIFFAILVASSFVFQIEIAKAAACCAGSSALPSLMTGDEKAKLGLQVSEGHIIGDAPARGIPVFRKSANEEMNRTYQFNASTLITDRLQAGVGLPFVQYQLSHLNGQNYSGLGDFALSVSYEALPEWGYQPYIPKGFVFFGLSLPTGKSMYDSSDSSQVSGKGFYTPSVGADFLKQWGSIDATIVPEVHYSFSRTFDGQEPKSQTDVSGFFGSSILFGSGYNIGNFRTGISIQPVFTQRKEVKTLDSVSVSENQLVWNTGISFAYLYESYAVNLSYVDQTLFGPAINTSLSRTVVLGFEHRWWR